MKTKVDITDWIKNGDSFKSFILGAEIDVDKVKRFEYVGDSKDYGYYYSKEGWRIGISGEIIDEIGIPVMFLPKKIKVIINIKNKVVPIEKLKIHEFLELLNELGLKWEPVKYNDTSRLQVFLPKPKIYVIFNIYEGLIELISKGLPLGSKKPSTSNHSE